MSLQLVNVETCPSISKFNMHATYYKELFQENPDVDPKEEMDSMRVLPDDILRQQVCQECFAYLSVPPIVVNNQGHTICGRCVGLTQDGQKTKSLFNTVASGFCFKCINHFNGCTKVLSFEEVQSHEKECFYEPQECILCSFSGNLSQIFNHAVKVHPENVSLYGIIPLSLSNLSLEKTLFIPIIKDNHLLLVRIELTERLFKIVLKLITKELPLNLNQYAVKFYRSGYQESIDYGLFSISHENVIEKPTEELTKIFGPANIHCEILMDTFTFEKKELDLQRRLLDLRRSEELLTNRQRKLEMERAEIISRKILMDTLEKKDLELQRTILDLQRSEEHVTNLEHQLEMKRGELHQKQLKYDLAEKVIKKMSCNFFDCSKCRKGISGETFFCPKFHCYCKSCLSSFCDVCGVVREFSKLPTLEKFTVKCAWPGCDADISIKTLWDHKTKCDFRPYKCPLQNCNKIILSIEKLREHWHTSSPILIVGNEVICSKYGCEEYYLILKNDIYHLLINFDLNDIHVYIEEHNVLQEAVKFECSASGLRDWTKLAMSQICGRYEINTKNSFDYYGVKFNRIKIGISLS